MNIKLKLNLNMFLFLLLFFLTGQLEIYALVMVFALVHELAHLICEIILGFKIDIFKIMPLGFSIEFKPVVEDYNQKILKSNMITIKKIIVALAGPLINLLIVILGAIFNIDRNIIYSNLLLLIFNLTPIYPLDGGRILKNLIKIFCGNIKANKYINLITNIFTIILTMTSSIFILIYKNIAILAVLIVIWGMTIKENNKYNTYNKIYKTIDKNYNYL